MQGCGAVEIDAWKSYYESQISHRPSRGQRCHFAAWFESGGMCFLLPHPATALCPSF